MSKGICRYNIITTGGIFWCFFGGSSSTSDFGIFGGSCTSDFGITILHTYYIGRIIWIVYFTLVPGPVHL